MQVHQILSTLNAGADLAGTPCGHPASLCFVRILRYLVIEAIHLTVDAISAYALESRTPQSAGYLS